MSDRSAYVPHSRLWLQLGRWLAFAAAMTVFALVYLRIAQSHINEMVKVPPDAMEASHLRLAQATIADQAMDLSKGISGPMRRWMPHRTDGISQPLWPWLTAWLVQDQKDIPILLGKARWLQLGIVLGFLLVLGITCMRRFSLPAAILVVVLAALCGFLPTLGVFDSSILFMVLLLLTWTACIFALQRNSLWIHGLLGGLGGVAYLTDERILPLLGVFVVTSTLRALWGWIAAHWPGEHGTSLWVRRNHLFGLIILIFTFFFVSGPRLMESSERFGSAFFSYVSHTRWLDSTEAAQEWTVAHPDAASLAAVPPRQIPSWSLYSETHTHEQLFSRLKRGLDAVWRDFFYAGGVWTGGLALVFISLSIAILITTPKADHAGQKLHPETANILLFEILAIASYVLIAAWDADVLGSQKVLQFLQIPLILSLVWACESLLRRARRRRARKALFIGYQAALWALLCVVGWQVITGLQTSPIAP